MTRTCQAELESWLSSFRRSLRRLNHQGDGGHHFAVLRCRVQQPEGRRLAQRGDMVQAPEMAYQAVDKASARKEVVPAQARPHGRLPTRPRNG